MDTNQLTALLTGAVIISSGLTYTATELTGEEVLKEGEETPIVEEVPAVQANVVFEDDVCGEDSLYLMIGTRGVCSNSEVYNEFKTGIGEDLQTIETTWTRQDGSVCDGEEEGCTKSEGRLTLPDKDVLATIFLKESIKRGEVIPLQELTGTPEERKAIEEANVALILEVFSADPKLEIIK